MGSSERAGAWDPAVYLRFAGERARPFLDLVARVDVTAPGTVVDRDPLPPPTRCATASAG